MNMDLPLAQTKITQVTTLLMTNKYEKQIGKVNFGETFSQQREAVNLSIACRV